MFFIVSKIFWLAGSPLHLGLLCLCVGLAVGGRSRFGRPLAAASAIGLALMVFTPLDALLMRPLENRFPRQSLEMAAPTGIIVLGGATDERISFARDQIALNDAAERMTEAVALARLYPQAKLVFSGGSGNLVHNTLKEADAAHRLWSELGVPESQMVFEDRSRNTYENALFTKALVNPKPGERWLLVTSAYHMPRAMGIFRELGMDPIAYPVDYRTFGTAEDWRPPSVGALAILNFETALREWIGLLVYRLDGKTDALFPGP